MKTNMFIYICRYIRVALFGIMLWWAEGQTIYAATGSVTFGSDSYQWEQAVTNPIGVYITGDEMIAHYEICLSYDETMLRYIDGASEQVGNLLYIRGEGNEAGYMAMLHFETLQAGNTQLQVVSAVCTTQLKPVDVSGNDVLRSAAENFQMIPAAAPINIFQRISSRLAELTVEPWGIVDFAPEVLDYNIEVPAETERLQVSYVPEDAEAQVTVSDTDLQVGDNTITVAVQGTEEDSVYTLHVTRLAPAEPSIEPTVEPTVDQAGSSIEAMEQEQELSLEESEELTENNIEFVPDWIWIEKMTLIVGCILVAILAISYLAYTGKVRLAEFKNGRSDANEVKVIDLDSTAINVSHVTMRFKMAKDEASSLKEYLIRAVKGKNQYSYLTALNDVSFQVKQGDVVGIIGTNGSGKSTILKIVSGAIKPTKGHVDVERSKVQMLTLGTGFDMELTARENVYLNGSIIGYTKEYIDEKYDDIVKFAELEGFMEERMKNFSSGMVSRLGFAIATMRDTPDILILDEVLSVGDMFFRQKSEKRIKEMIHSGATVLIVSHSMDTIMKNCNKVVWIEKGVLRMVGDPKTVCEAYQKLEQ